MQFEDFDKKIKEAADHHHPAYNEDAWGKMEKLLDKHMPQEKDDRRRFIFFILIPVLLAGSAWLLISKPWVEKKAIAKTEQSVNPASNPTNTISTSTSKDSNKEAGTVNVTDIPSTDAPVENTKNTQARVVANHNTIMHQKQPLSSDKTISGTGADQQFDATISSPATRKKKAKQPVIATIDKPDEVRAATDNANAVQTNTVIAKQDEITPIAADKPVIENKTLLNPITSQEIKTENKKEETITSADYKEQVAEAPIAKQKKSSSKKKSSFFISASVGPDISAAGTDRIGKVKLLAGAGLGYTYKDHLTIRTGFYTGRKVYSASPDQYNPEPPFWQYYPYMERIDADCKVYEIPLLVTYHFGNAAKRNWFVGTGISTYLMKEEVYDYYYKTTPTGQTRHRRWTVDNENKHFFSVVTLSGGYQRNFDNKFLLMAEPFVKIPLGGVGFGNVKLNSAGLMLTVGYKPFERAKSSRKISIPAKAIAQ